MLLSIEGIPVTYIVADDPGNCADGMIVESKPSIISLSGKELLEFIQPLMAEGIAVKFKAHGRSMMPFIREGDVITLSPNTGSRIRLGAVVAIRHPNTGGLVTHRVVKRMGNRCMIQGDNAMEADGIVALSAVIGVVAEVQRNGRDVSFGGKWLEPLIAPLVRWGITCRWNSFTTKLMK